MPFLWAQHWSFLWSFRGAAVAGPASDGHWCRAHRPGDGREYRGVHPEVTERENLVILQKKWL